MLTRPDSHSDRLFRRVARLILAPGRLVLGLMTVGAVIILFEIIGFIDDALPEEQKIGDWI